MDAREIRLGWIEASIRYSGGFSGREKSAYGQIFGLSEATVSRDQALFANLFEAASGGEVFQRSDDARLHGGKLNLIAEANLPEKHVFTIPGINRWLEDAMGADFVRPASSFRVPPDSLILSQIIDAISSRKIMKVDYLSRTRSSVKFISIHSLVHIVGRHHARAFDHSENRFADFILSRMTSMHEDNSSFTFVGRDKDTDWHETCSITISAVSDGVTDGVFQDFGLDMSGRRTIRERRAIAPYLSDNHAIGYQSPVTVEME